MGTTGLTGVIPDLRKDSNAYRVLLVVRWRPALRTVEEIADVAVLSCTGTAQSLAALCDRGFLVKNRDGWRLTRKGEICADYSARPDKPFIRVY